MILFLCGYLAGFITLPCAFIVLLWIAAHADWSDAGCTDAPNQRHD